MHSGGLAMALTKYKLGELIELVTETNSELKYSIDDAVGMTITKEIIPTKANLEGTDLTKFLVVKPNEFVFNPRTHGKKIGFGYNDSKTTFIISWNNIAFKVKESMSNTVLSDYLFLHFRRDEWDREACYQSWGTSTEVFTWDALCGMSLDLPDIETQQKYVDVYKAMVANQKAYERGLDDLKLTCDAYIEDLRRKLPCEKIGKYIFQVNEKNSSNQVTLEQGININKEFITPQRSNSDLSSRVIVRKGQIAYCTQLNNQNVAIALRDDDDCVVSPVYSVIDVLDKSKLLPVYLFVWLIRPEWGRFVYWNAIGSAYEFLQYESVCDTEIPIPDMAIQKSIVDIYSVYKKRKEINEKLKTQIKNICPILIKGSLEEGSNEVTV